MVPPRYGGSRDDVNLAPLCGQHHEKYEQMFADVFVLEEGAMVRGVEWREVTTELHDQFERMGWIQLRDCR